MNLNYNKTHIFTNRGQREKRRTDIEKRKTKKDSQEQVSRLKVSLMNNSAFTIQ